MVHDDDTQDSIADVPSDYSNFFSLYQQTLSAYRPAGIWEYVFAKNSTENHLIGVRLTVCLC